VNEEFSNKMLYRVNFDQNLKMDTMDAFMHVPLCEIEIDSID
jgi:hypothetical protein